jgi:hypothetical protein
MNRTVQYKTLTVQAVTKRTGIIYGNKFFFSPNGILALALQTPLRNTVASMAGRRIIPISSLWVQTQLLPCGHTYARLFIRLVVEFFFPFSIRFYPLNSPPRIRQTAICIFHYSNYYILGRVSALSFHFDGHIRKPYPKIESFVALKDIPVPITLSTQPRLSPVFCLWKRQSA